MKKWTKSRVSNRHLNVSAFVDKPSSNSTFHNHHSQFTWVNAFPQNRQSEIIVSFFLLSKLGENFLNNCSVICCL